MKNEVRGEMTDMIIPDERPIINTAMIMMQLITGPVMRGERFLKNCETMHKASSRAVSASLCTELSDFLSDDVIFYLLEKYLT